MATSTAASELTDEALVFERMGDFPTAEALLLEALNAKIELSGEHSLPVAVAKRRLANLYVNMGKRDEAQKLIAESPDVCIEDTSHKVTSVELNQPWKKGLDFACIGKNDFDSACRREDRGRAYEATGDHEKAIVWRTMGAPDKMLCSYRYDCPKINNKQLSKKDELTPCFICRAAFYCSIDCQIRDWPQHRHFCKRR